MADHNCASCGEISTNLGAIKHTQCCLSSICPDCYQAWSESDSEQKCFNCLQLIVTSRPYDIFVKRLLSQLPQLRSSLTQSRDRLTEIAADLAGYRDHHCNNVAIIARQLQSQPQADSLRLQLATTSQAIRKDLQLQSDRNTSDLRIVANMLNYLTVVEQRLCSDCQDLLQAVEIANSLASIDDSINGYFTAGEKLHYQAVYLYRHRLQYSIHSASLASRLSWLGTGPGWQQRSYPGLARNIARLVELTAKAAGYYNYNSNNKIVGSIIPNPNQYWLLFEASNSAYLVNCDGYVTQLGRQVMTLNHKWLLDCDGPDQVIRLWQLDYNLNTAAVVRVELALPDLPELIQLNQASMALDGDLLYIQYQQSWCCYDLVSNQRKFLAELITVPPGYEPDWADYKLRYVHNNLVVLAVPEGFNIITFQLDCGQVLDTSPVEPGFDHYEVQAILEDDSLIITDTTMTRQAVLYRFEPGGGHTSINIKSPQHYRQLTLLADGTIAGLVDHDEYWVDTWRIVED